MYDALAYYTVFDSPGEVVDRPIKAKTKKISSK